MLQFGRKRYLGRLMKIGPLKPKLWVLIKDKLMYQQMYSSGGSRD